MRRFTNVKNNVSTGVGSINTTISTTSTITTTINDPRTVNEYTLKYYLMDKLVTQKLINPLNDFMNNADPEFHHRIFGELGNILENDSLFSWSTASTNSYYFKQKKIIDPSVFESYKSHLHDVIDILYKYSEISKENNELNNIIAMYENIINNPDNMIHYYNARYRTLMLSELDQDVNIDLMPSILPQYERYINEYGIPDNGIFESENLSQIINIMESEGLTVEYPYTLFSFDFNESNITDLHDCVKNGFLDGTWTQNDNVPKCVDGTMIIGFPIWSVVEKHWQQTDSASEINYGFQPLYGEKYIFEIKIQSFYLTNTTPSNKGIKITVKDDTSKQIAIGLYETMDGKIFVRYENNIETERINFDANTMTINIILDLSDKTYTVELLNHTNNNKIILFQESSLNISNISNIGFDVESPDINNWQDNDNFILIEKMALSYYS